MQLSVFKGSKDIARLLLKSGADSNKRNIQSKTALDIAVEKNNAMIQTLLLNGADPENRCTCGNHKDMDGNPTNCPSKPYEFALQLKEMNSLKIFLNATHSF